MIDFKRPRGFEDFDVYPVELPAHPDWDYIYDLENKIIWVNTAAGKGANVTKLEPKRR